MSASVTELFEVFWCPTCGVVWADEEPPICKHGTNLAHKPTRMEPIPSWHPYANSASGEPQT